MGTDEVSTRTKTRSGSCASNDAADIVEEICSEIGYCTCSDRPDHCSGVNQQCAEESENSVKTLVCHCLHPYQLDENLECKKCIALRPFSQQCYGTYNKIRFPAKVFVRQDFLK